MVDETPAPEAPAPKKKRPNRNKSHRHNTAFDMLQFDLGKKTGAMKALTRELSFEADVFRNMAALTERGLLPPAESKVREHLEKLLVVCARIATEYDVKLSDAAVNARIKARGKGFTSEVQRLSDGSGNDR